MRKNVLITGGTRGIGEAIAKEFAKSGYDVIINYVKNGEKAEALKQELETGYKIRVFPIKADLSSEKEMTGMVENVEKEFGKIDVLINNAGIVIDKEFTDRTVEEWNQTLSVNLIAPFFLTKLIGKKMKEQKNGVIINLSSTNGMDTYYPTSVDYDASKAGLISLTHNSAVEFSPYVRVNCIAPGWVNTEMNQDLDEEFIQKENKRILVGRFGNPEEVAKVAKFLASDDASYINSSVIRVDGGWY